LFRLFFVGVAKCDCDDSQQNEFVQHDVDVKCCGALLEGWKVKGVGFVGLKLTGFFAD
jgi:hypothetical protein